MCLAQRHNAVTPMMLEPAAPRSQVKHSPTALPPPPPIYCVDVYLESLNTHIEYEYEHPLSLFFALSSHEGKLIMSFKYFSLTSWLKKCSARSNMRTWI